MTNASDPVSGDADAGPGAQLWGGNGNYYLSASKTAAGARLFYDHLPLLERCWRPYRYGSGPIASPVTVDIEKGIKVQAISKFGASRKRGNGSE